MNALRAITVIINVNDDVSVILGKVHTATGVVG